MLVCRFFCPLRLFRGCCGYSLKHCKNVSQKGRKTGHALHLFGVLLLGLLLGFWLLALGVVCVLLRLLLLGGRLSHAEPLAQTCHGLGVGGLPLFYVIVPLCAVCLYLLTVAECRAAIAYHCHAIGNLHQLQTLGRCLVVGCVVGLLCGCLLISFRLAFGLALTLCGFPCLALLFHALGILAQFCQYLGRYGGKIYVFILSYGGSRKAYGGKLLRALLLSLPASCINARDTCFTVVVLPRLHQVNAHTFCKQFGGFCRCYRLALTPFLPVVGGCEEVAA